MTPEERRKRIRELMAGLDASEVNLLISELHRDIAEEQRRRVPSSKPCSRSGEGTSKKLTVRAFDKSMSNSNTTAT